MLWRVNGMIMLSKGANMIPMEELEGRMNAEAHRQLVVSSRDSKKGHFQLKWSRLIRYCDCRWNEHTSGLG